MRNNEVLTGKRRYRTHRTIGGKSLLVLQVEVSFGEGPDDHNGMPAYLAGRDWRDAMIEDLSIQEKQP